MTALVMILGCAHAETALKPEQAAAPVELNEVPVYLTDRDTVLDEKYPILLLDGVRDMPYTELGNWAGFMNYIMTDGGQTPGYHLTMETDELLQQVTLIRETGFTACFDFNEGTIVFSDYVGFTNYADSAYMDVAELPVPDLLTMTSSRNLYGNFTTLDLREYGIPMTVLDGHYLLPLQTLAAFFLFPHSFGAYYNGEALFLTPISAMVDPLDTMIKQLYAAGKITPEVEEKYSEHTGTKDERFDYLLELVSETPEEKAELTARCELMKENSLYQLYTSVPAAERSSELAAYSYEELCLEMDCFYGLKEAHGVSSFSMFLLQAGLSEALASPDAAAADQAASNLVDYWLDDGHSGFISPSGMAASAPDKGTGFGYELSSMVARQVSGIRDRYPDAKKQYYEVGDSAYVTFDAFAIERGSDGRLPDYYALAQEGTLPEDTLGITIDAHRRITRENSPIKNVVLDLSCNGGGTVSAAVYTLCWFLGVGRVSVDNTFTGARSTMFYTADINMDHVRNEQDTLANRGLNLYCLVSPLSFSCANLVPWAFKENGSVTLLGKTSGGGSSLVAPMNTAWGTTLQISGTDRIAFVKNGSYYDVDQGVEPDHVIDTFEHFYDRDTLTEYIHSLY